MNPCKLDIIINEIDIINIVSNRSRSRAPNIKKKIQSTSRHTSGSRIGQLMTLALFTRITNHVFIGITNKRKPMAIKDLLDYMSGSMP
jgi:hypothetical protein